ncbi:helix-turn-helix domain-containing protein [Rossellomorea vietnamensis]|uniref:XRE family transcriptional regulator n=1 Tax=Rossellomorea vietnamensis TaxID=218284 RepID=A0A0P6WPL5_9BACI|nr:helix-turn-helix domain-containing protein [Rossellomorea vietnamensis]KPL59430.1 XRE family transcriptional regulator [Rossellomorea vietnamensis]
MDYSIIGKKIKELRKVVGLTQGDLAEGICTQALVSRIEKGDIYPSATALYQISEKLGVDVNYFFEIGTTPRLDYVKEVERQLRNFRVRLQYDEMIEMVKAEEKNPLFFRNPTNLQLLYWHKSIYLFEIEKDQKNGLALLKEALSLTTNKKRAMTEREIEIQMTLGAFEHGQGNLQESLAIYDEVRSAIQSSTQLNDKSIKTRLLYNIARTLTRLGKYKESNSYCDQAIKWCLEEEHLFGLGELYYHTGYNYELEGELEKALSFIDKSILIFDMYEDNRYHQYLQKKREDISRKLGIL